MNELAKRGYEGIGIKPLHAIPACGALTFPRSTYYKNLVRVPSNRQREYNHRANHGNVSDDIKMPAKLEGQSLNT